MAAPEWPPYGGMDGVTTHRLLKKRWNKGRVAPTTMLWVVNLLFDDKLGKTNAKNNMHMRIGKTPIRQIHSLASYYY